MVLLQLSSAPSLLRSGRRRKTHFFLLSSSPSSSIVCKHHQYRSNQAFHGSSAPSPLCFFYANTLIHARKALTPAEKTILHKNKTLNPIQAFEGERVSTFTEEIMLLNGDLIVNEDDGGDGSGYGEMHNKPDEKLLLNPNSNKILTLPTLLTLARVVSIPVLLCGKILLLLIVYYLMHLFSTSLNSLFSSSLFSFSSLCYKAVLFSIMQLS